jgi:hypothetical protein
MRIASVVARQLLDCKARPSVEVEITTDTAQTSYNVRKRASATYWRQVRRPFPQQPSNDRFLGLPVRPQAALRGRHF